MTCGWVARCDAAVRPLAIDLHGGPRSALADLGTRAPVRVGYDVPGRTWMYTHVAHRPRVLRPRHSVENQWDLLAAVDPRASGRARSGDRPRRDDGRSGRARLGRASGWRASGCPDDAHVIVLHVSAGNPFRRWPEASFAALASRLATGGAGRWVLVTGGPSDREAAARVLSRRAAAPVATAGRILDGEGWSLAELRALMDRAALFVGGDSGPLHVAATSDVPVVGLYGPTLAERSAPWRAARLPTASVDAGSLPCRPCDQRVCAPGDFRCLTGISAGRVLEAAEQLLESRA